MNDDQFEERNAEKIREMGRDSELRELSRQWFERSSRFEYSYHFRWLGLPILQFPQDVVALQEIVWKVKPRLVVETGVARGGSLVFYASLLEMIGGEGTVVGIDVDIRPHNRAAIEGHPLSKRIVLLSGSSTDEEVLSRVKGMAEGSAPVLVVLDSNHTHEHVLEELRSYAPLVSEGSYLVVLDTVIGDMPESFSSDRPWGPGRNPGTAVEQFLRENDGFEVDRMLESKLQITVAPGGYLKCVRKA